MREVIARNEYYEIEVDREKNRSYSKYKGYWPSVEAVSDYPKDIERLLASLKPGFTTLLDMRDETGVKIPPPEVMDLLIEATKKYEAAGLSRSARVVTKPLEKMAAQRVGTEANIKEKVRAFNTMQDAEAWLDEG